MESKTETAILEAITAQQDVLKGITTRMDVLEEQARVVTVTSHDVAVASPKTIDRPPKSKGHKVTTIKADDPELLSLRGQITREGKARLIDKCAAHSVDALRTLILAGGRAAREFMADKRTAATADEEFHLVDSANGRYAHARLGRMESGKGPTVVISHTKTVGAAKMTADMTDEQLLAHRPVGASNKYAARHAWLKRTRANLGS
jgi:hypothetical protein